MDIALVQVAIAGGIPLLAGLIWVVKLDGRMTAHERECGERQRRLDERHDEVTKKLDAMDAKMDRLLVRL